MSNAGTRRRLLLLRHGKAAASAGPTGEAGDHARDLAERGHRDATALGARLRGEGLIPELALVSSALRTRRTWDALGPFDAPAPELLVTDRLYLAEAEELLAVLRQVPDTVATVLLVGHNPGLHLLSLTLAAGIGDDAGLAGGMPTCTLARFGIEGSWSGLRPAAVRGVQVMRP